MIFDNMKWNKFIIIKYEVGKDDGYLIIRIVH